MVSFTNSGRIEVMTATAHALVGGAIAVSIQNPAIGLPLAAASHPFIDMIPHWDFGFGWRKKGKFLLFIQSGLDFSAGILLTYLIFGQFVDFSYLMAAVFLSESWDLLMMPRLLFNWNFPPFSTFYNVQHKFNTKAKLPWGIINQAVTVISIILVLRIFH